MKYLTVARLSILLFALGFALSVIGILLWRFEPWGFKLSFNIGSGILMLSTLILSVDWIFVLYKLNGEHFGVDKE